MLTVIDHIEISSTTLFTDLNTEITKTYIPTLASALENKLFGTSEPVPPPTDSKSDDADVVFKVGGDIAKVWQHTPCGWLYDKLESHLPKDAGPDFDPTVFSQVLTDLLTDVVDATMNRRGDSGSPAPADPGSPLKAVSVLALMHGLEILGMPRRTWNQPPRDDELGGHRRWPDRRMRTAELAAMCRTTLPT